MALRESRLDLAAQAFKANRRLIEFAQQPALVSVSIQEIAFSWEIWSSLTDEDLQTLSENYKLAELLPPRLPTSEEMQSVVRARATLRRDFGELENRNVREPLSSDLGGYLWAISIRPSSSFPPLRWAQQRQQSLALNRALARLKNPSSPRQEQFIDDDIVPDTYLWTVALASNTEARTANFPKQESDSNSEN